MNVRRMQNGSSLNRVICVAFTGALVMAMTFYLHRFGKGTLTIFQKVTLKESGTMVDYMTFLDPPSTLPYKLQYSTFSEQYFPYRVIQRLYPPDIGLKNGFFVEAGALDGEFLSNSLYLELQLGWRGLLVEPFLESYRKLRRNHRKAWTCYCCLGNKQYPYKAHLANHVGIRNNKYSDSTPEAFKHGSNFIVGTKYANQVTEVLLGMEYETIQCLPIKAILKEIKVEKIDLFSLDVEGTELGVLKSFPWDDVKVDVWVVEHFNLDVNYTERKTKLDLNFISWFNDKGYDLYDSDASSGDYIFVVKNSSLTNAVF